MNQLLAGADEANAAKKNKIRKKRVESLSVVLRTTLVAFFAVLFLMPIILTITNSFMSASEISSNYGQVFSNRNESEQKGKTYIGEKINLKLIPDIVTFSQYNTVLFKSPDYLLKFWNSVILVLPIVLFQILVAMGAAYGLSRYRSRLKEMIFFMYIILMLIPYQVTLVPNYLVSEKLHLLDTYWAIWLPGIFSPFAVFMLTKYMRRIPNSIMEAASMDGCGEWQIFWQIAIPLCKGGMFSVGILLFIDYWNMVEQPIILLQNQDKHPLSVFLSKINQGEMGLAFAVATIYMVIPLLIFLYGEDYLVDGISYQGGVKG